MERLLHHEGHAEHPLTLMPRKVSFECDACGEEEEEDFSYICTICEFWVHKRCATSPYTVLIPHHHHHTLNLVYSIPDMHRCFDRYCNICDDTILTNDWVYYCHKCTYFAHIKCATSLDIVSTGNEIDTGGTDNEPHLVQCPLRCEESLLDLIVTQCGKLQVDFQGEGENSDTIPTITNDPQIIEEHWSHKNHPLVHLQFTNSENVSGGKNDESRVLICDGCILPITISCPSYYACIQCDFFLHSFCATKLPQKLPVGASPFHPEHSLLLTKKTSFYEFVRCGACCCVTNGIYYHCETCDINIDVRCAFSPTSIRLNSHKHDLFFQSQCKELLCRASKVSRPVGGMVYQCQSCKDLFEIDIVCAFYPNRMNHRYDLHPITLRFPPFFYEGVFYCEICEEQVNNQCLLYHCEECDQSFHHECIRLYENVKLGGTIKLSISKQPHTLALVLKKTARKNSPLYLCGNCGNGYKSRLFFECYGCGLLICCKCAINML